MKFYPTEPATLHDDLTRFAITTSYPHSQPIQDRFDSRHKNYCVNAQQFKRRCNDDTGYISPLKQQIGLSKRCHFLAAQLCHIVSVYTDNTITFVGCIACTKCKDVACLVCRGLSVSVCRSRAKMAELIELLFGTWTWVGPRNHVLGEGPDVLRGGAIFWRG